MGISVVTLAERPDPIEPMWQMPSTWPEFMLHDPVADRGPSSSPAPSPGARGGRA